VHWLNLAASPITKLNRPYQASEHRVCNTIALWAGYK
jgi:hypothetical protein